MRVIGFVFLSFRRFVLITFIKPRGVEVGIQTSQYVQPEFSLSKKPICLSFSSEALAYQIENGYPYPVSS